MTAESSGNGDGIEQLGVRKPFGEVFKAEIDALDTIRTRPFNAGARRPPLDVQLVGLALSGGGIRSAAVALGVIQALAAKGVFGRIHYLSTVSGGGYTGAALIAGLWRSNRAGEPRLSRDFQSTTRLQVVAS